MKPMPLNLDTAHFSKLLLSLITINSAKFTFAGIIHTKDGSILSGKILSIEEGIIQIETFFAGIIRVRQSEVGSLEIILQGVLFNCEDCSVRNN